MDMYILLLKCSLAEADSERQESVRETYTSLAAVGGDTVVAAAPAMGRRQSTRSSTKAPVQAPPQANPLPSSSASRAAGVHPPYQIVAF